MMLCLCIFPLYMYGQNKFYHFDQHGISREVLENYLDRSITYSAFLDAQYKNPRIHADNVRMLKNTGAKFIGRAIARWENEQTLNGTDYWDKARKRVEEMHAIDPDIIFQGCIFETVSTQVNTVAVPAWVFESYGLKPEKRNFRYNDMLSKEGKYVDHWHKGGSVPDITRLETRLWFQFLAGSYINIGCEALHLGQIELIGMHDANRTYWDTTIQHIRDYAKKSARRHWIILDAHTPKGGMLKEGRSLIDFNSFPMRICAIPSQPKPGEPQRAELRVNHLDGIYLKSKGCTTPSGWTCNSLPYLVEIDNYGKKPPLDVADTTSYHPWGWDEISWYAKQPETYRNKWLKKVWKWIKITDPNGHIEMPGYRWLCCPNKTNNIYQANTKSEDCPYGYNQEETIKAIWKKDKQTEVRP